MFPTGLSDLELRHIVERAFLPDTCEIQDVDAQHVHLKVTSHEDSRRVVFKEWVPHDALVSMRALAGLVQEVRELFDTVPASRPAAAHSQSGARSGPRF
ncbi:MULTISPECIES: DUF1652 domain-containing protein [unclassified Pseudomonas]|uniref:DUF1652 domain-containing protein n=1 Tax=unclassified Pseudomonas TaxID=196821 RepID=UPI000BC9BF62|nr:uncharacterized protein DUF1652 [Pseudomonas sp. URIL14HWK12:I12]PVZ22843.1 uncharacterized protein DUF1652 [Pseudomonas sp. URIL14HWK12:I10]PVZ37527.1 uncharacterized protein DUF1652 [Pseudomonas sp. URIL14HWK12:I11]SNZ15010.1 Protein of unknown function [Pseudomonas sp. URIL14HWK12:I9]